MLLQSAAPAACPAKPVIPAELAGWTSHRPVTAGATAAQAAPIAIGASARTTLIPAAQATLAVPVTKPPAEATSAGLLAFTVPAAGRYRVALGAGAWVEVIAAGKAVASVAHGHGPACSPVRKMVDFDLQPGRHLLQLSGSAASTLDVAVARLR